MKLKSICLAIAILGVFAALAFWVDRSRSREKKKEGPVGENLVAHEIIESTTEILLGDSDEEGKLHLQLGDDNTWILPEYHQFPVEFSKLESLTHSLIDAKVIRLVTRNPERMERLEFGDNTIELKSAEGETIWSLLTGKRGTAGGRFVKLHGDDAAYLSDISLYIDTDEKNWAEKKLLDIELNQVESLKLDYPGEDRSLSIARETHEAPFSSEDIAEDQEVDDSEAESLLRTLIDARFSDVKEPDDLDALAALEHSRNIELFLFNGENYSLRIGRKPAEPIEKEEEPESVGTDETPESEEGTDTGTTDSETPVEEDEPEMTDPGPVFIFYSTVNPQSRLNSLMERVSLTYSSYTFDQINESIASLVQARKEPEELGAESKEGS